MSDPSHNITNYDDIIDGTCIIPPNNPFYYCDDEKSDNSLFFRAITAGFIAFIYIAIFVYIADRYGPFWAGIYGSIPGTLLAAILFEHDGKIPSLILALILGGIASVASALIFYFLIKSSEVDKYTAFTAAVIIWVALIIILFVGFRDQLKKKSDHE